MTKKKRLSLRVALLRWSDHPLMLNFYRMTRWLRQSLGMLSTTSFHYQPHLLQPATAKPRNKMHKSVNSERVSIGNKYAGRIRHFWAE
jgi:hypothetical protein